MRGLSVRLSSPLSLAGLVVVLDELGLDVFPQCVVVFGGPVSQDAGGELVLVVTRTTQDHLHHLFTGPETQTGHSRETGQQTGQPRDRLTDRCLTSPGGAAAAGRIRLLDVLQTEETSVKKSPFRGQTASPGLTFILQVLQDGDDCLQRDVVGQEQLPGAVLLKGLPVQRLNCGNIETREDM